MKKLLDKWVLDENGKPIPEPDLMKWATWFETSKEKRVVKQDQIGDKMVSTVFLSLNHQWGEGYPILWETLVFGKDGSEDGERYHTKEEALAGHERYVKQIQEENAAKD